MSKRRYCGDCPLLENEFFGCKLGYTIKEHAYSDDCKLVRIECEDRVILPNISNLVPCSKCDLLSFEKDLEWDDKHELRLCYYCRVQTGIDEMLNKSDME
jgi:hypothetical protein